MRDGWRRRLAAVALLSAAVGVISVPRLLGQEEPSPHQLMFVPPPVEGAVSLGVYDGRGRLVRVLAKAAEVESFKAGLNGLLVDWNGNDADGKPVPAGRYYARGVVVGQEVEIAGEAFHFNDFADNSGAPRPQVILDAATYGTDGVAVLAQAARLEVLLESAKGTEARHVPVTLANGANALRSAGANLLLLFNDDRAQLLDPKTATVAWEVAGTGLRDAATDGARTLLLWASGPVLVDGGVTRPLAVPGGNPVRGAVLRSTTVLAAADGNFWTVEGGEVAPLGLKDPKPLVDLAAGRDDTVWALSREGERTLVRRIDVRTREVRDLELPPELGAANRLSASREADALVLLLKGADAERVVGLRFQDARADASVWEKWFDRARRSFPGFTLKDGAPVPSEDRSESPAVPVRPLNNPLENTRQPLFQLSAFADDTGLWLANSDGLPLLQVSKTKGVRQVRWASDGQNGVRVFASDGRVVEQYRVTGLANLYRFNAGSFD